MDRVEIEPITKAKITEIGDSELDSLIKFYEKRFEVYKDSAASEIIPVLKNEMEWRNKVKAVKCPWLLLSGYCRQTITTTKYGNEHLCPVLSGGKCTAKKIEAIDRFL